MKTTRVKFCGITRQEDALRAQALGVDALGFVFYESSPRYIKPQQAREIIQQLPPFVTNVGLFVNASYDLVKYTSKFCQLDRLQFHGDESEDFCASFHQPYIKAIAVSHADDILQAEQTFYSAAALLLDTPHATLPGGTGQTFDWSQLDTVKSVIKKPLIIAGGLTIDNVHLAIQTLSPYGVDVSTGIEFAKGLKSTKKMQAFMNEVNKFHE